MSYPYYFILIILTVVALLVLFQAIKKNILTKELIILLLLVVFGWGYPIIPVKIDLDSVDYTNFWLSSDAIGSEMYKLNDIEKEELFGLLEENKTIKIGNKLGFEQYGDSVTVTIITGDKDYHIYLVHDSKKDIYLSNGKKIYKLRQKIEVHEFIYSIIDSIN